MRKQRAFAKLTPSEVEQIAEWLRTGIYEDVLERIAKPRPEGFGLKVSIKPLQLLREKRERVDDINKRIKEGKPLSLADFDAIQAGERQNVTDEVHRAIMDSTYEIATSGENTPTDLLKLQTLADFETRSELRAQKAELEQRRDQRADETAAHRKEMNEKRLALAEKAFQLRERMAEAKLNDSETPTRKPKKIDALGRLASNLDDVERRASEQFNLPYDGPAKDGNADSPQSTDTSEPTNDDAPGLQSACSSLSETSSQALSDPSESQLSHAVGTTSMASHLSDPTNTGLQSGGVQTHDTQTASAVSSPENPDALSPVQQPPNPCSSELVAPELSGGAPSAVKGSELSTPPSALSLEPSALVKSHAIRRWRAHIPRPKDAPGSPEPDDSWREECPCGNSLPCAEHGEMPLRAKWYRPQHPEYKNLLEQSGVPFYIPTPEELGCTKEELDRSLDPFTNNPKIPCPPDQKFSCLFQPGDNPYVWPGGIPLI